MFRKKHILIFKRIKISNLVPMLRQQERRGSPVPVYDYSGTCDLLTISAFMIFIFAVYEYLINVVSGMYFVNDTLI